MLPVYASLGAICTSTEPWIYDMFRSKADGEFRHILTADQIKVLPYPVSLLALYCTMVRLCLFLWHCVGSQGQQSMSNINLLNGLLNNVLNIWSRYSGVQWECVPGSLPSWLPSYEMKHILAFAHPCSFSSYSWLSDQAQTLYLLSSNSSFAQQIDACQNNK